MKPPTTEEARGFRQSIEYEELDKEAGIRAEAANTTILTDYPRMREEAWVVYLRRVRKV